jgi:K+-sensing histidine kinase KdpD
MKFRAILRQVRNKTVNTGIHHYFLAILVVGITALACIPLSNPEGYHVVSFILLFVVTILATFMGIGPVFLASAISALVWNYYFIPPNLTFHIDKAEDILMFGMFFIIAFLNIIYTTRVKKQEQLAVSRELRTNSLFQLTKELSKASNIEEVISAANNEIRNHFSADPFFILQDGKNILSHSGRLRKEKILNPIEYELAEWSFRNALPAGAYTDKLRDVEYTFFPLLGSQINPGVVAVRFTEWPDSEKKEMWDNFLAQTAIALEREFLAELAQKARFLDESDRLYKTLFNSISHELRIPVATIIGASDTLMNTTHSGEIQAVLHQEIFTASMRLNRLIENLLNMSRLESGLLSVRLDWHDITDVFNKVTASLADELKPFTLRLNIPGNMPLVRIDFGLIEQVLYNLLYNATQYAPPASVIELSTGFADNNLVIRISDRGPGFPQAELGNVFRKFFRLAGSASGGLGLGLSIVKGFVEAHKGTISVENQPSGGARFTIRIPSENANIVNLPPDSL